jgi:hypothetical protein
MKKIRELVSKYIQKTERVLAEIEITQDLTRIDDEKVRSVVEQAKSYLEDAKYYMEKKFRRREILHGEKGVGN